jgi:hypothetical protein
MYQYILVFSLALRRPAQRQVLLPRERHAQRRVRHDSGTLYLSLFVFPLSLSLSFSLQLCRLSQLHLVISYGSLFTLDLMDRSASALSLLCPFLPIRSLAPEIEGAADQHPRTLSICICVLSSIPPSSSINTHPSTLSVANVSPSL